MAERVAQLVARLRALREREPGRLPDGLRAELSPAAVLMLLWQEDDGRSLKLALTARPAHDGPHAGEVSLPGGRRQQGDEGSLGTALRETREELGVEVPRDAVVGQLDEAWSVSWHGVRTWVALLPERPSFTVCRREVAALLEADVRLLLEPGALQSRHMEWDGAVWTDVHFDVDGHLVWGLTSDLVLELLDWLRGAPGHRIEQRVAELSRFVEQRRVRPFRKPAAATQSG